MCLVINHLDVLYFNNEELDWIADKCGFADRNTMGGTFKKSLAKRPEATERAINYIFLF